ncbi:MAG: hypothetical protein GC190_21875 [Alphaproteobacteria bacterium]|nr:hypothetical protein [Alphaproteobacteria bacterium]
MRPLLLRPALRSDRWHLERCEPARDAAELRRSAAVDALRRDAMLVQSRDGRSMGAGRALSVLLLGGPACVYRRLQPLEPAGENQTGDGERHQDLHRDPRARGLEPEELPSRRHEDRALQGHVVQPGDGLALVAMGLQIVLLTGSLAVVISGIYEIRCHLTGKAYIGSAGDMRKRWATHVASLRAGKHHSAKLQAAWRKYGEGEFKINVLEIVEPKRLLEREQYYLDRKRGAYNMSPTAASPRGVRHTAQSRANMSAAHKGKGQSEEHRLARSRALKGQKPSPQTIAASVAFHSGRRQSEEERSRRSAGMKRAWAEGRFIREKSG